MTISFCKHRLQLTYALLACFVLGIASFGVNAAEEHGFNVTSLECSPALSNDNPLDDDTQDPLVGSSDIRQLSPATAPPRAAKVAALLLISERHTPIRAPPSPVS